MRQIKFRCSSIGKLMTEPKTKAEGILSVGAKTYIRELAQQEILGVEFEFSSKETAKGIQLEGEAIELLNRVRGLNLAKNTERKANDWITGECDLFDTQRKRGHDLKVSWSAKTFPGWSIDCTDKLYEWQMRGYQMLWNADEWEVNYALLDTPEALIGFEPLPLHVVSHIPEHLRLTTWQITRDKALEEVMATRIEAARTYYQRVIEGFAEEHPELETA